MEILMNKLVKLSVFALILVSFSALFSVDFDPDEAYDRFKKGFSVGGSLFPTWQGKALLLELDLYGSAEFSNRLGFGVGLPVRFILKNGSGADEIEKTGGIFPKEDWDDARDWVAILNYFHYGNSGDMFYFYFGEQRNRYVGNGSIVGAYFGDLRLYHPQRGVNLEVNTDYAGIDFFMDDVTPPNVVGGRVYLKPLSFLNKESYANNLEIGASYFADVFAPDKITSKTASSGEEERELFKSNAQIFGFDIDFRLLALKYYQLTFYTDINHIVDAGTGLHFGLKHKLMMPGSKDIQILSKWEVRAMESNYIPSYFNTFYDIEREYYKGQSANEPVTNTTKLQHILDLSGGNWTAGYYFDLVFDLTGIFSVGGSFEHNKLYTLVAGEARKYNNYQINTFINLKLFDAFFIDFMITLQSLGEEGKELKNQPYFRGSIAYSINKYFTVGFGAASKWYLYDYEIGEYRYYMSFSLGAFAGFRF